MTVHFDIDGSIEECQAFLTMVGFPVATAMSAKEQDALAVEEAATADKLKQTRQALEGLDGK